MSEEALAAEPAADDTSVAGGLFIAARTLEDAGDFSNAIRLYLDYLALDPDDYCGAVLRLANYGLARPGAAPVAYVATLFDQHAEDFDHILVDKLGYDVPAMIRRMAQPHLKPPVRLLDLGCGTGLVGACFNDLPGEMVGVDVSEKMLEMADARRVYDDLYVGEAIRFLSEWDEAPFDLIVAAELWPYLGDLAPFAAASFAALAPGGHVIASSERDETEWSVSRYQRFKHASDYVRQVLNAAGFEVLEIEPIIVRYEDGEPVHGDLVLARRPG